MVKSEGCAAHWERSYLPDEQKTLVWGTHGFLWAKFAWATRQTFSKGKVVP
jgi:hypothetical protein